MSGMTGSVNGSRTQVQRKRGSALITAVIMVFVIGMLTGAFFTLANMEYRTSTRSFLTGACFSLAEGGVDYAINALNNDDSSAWSVDGTTWTTKINLNENISNGATGQINIVIEDANTTTPLIYSEGVVSGHPIGDIQKLLRVHLSIGRGIGDSGLVADRIANNGNTVEIKQYDSRLGEPGETFADGTENWSDEIRVSTGTLEGGAINVGNADVYGYIATGGGEPYFGPNGGAYSFDDPTVHDASRVSYDYYENFDTVEVPSSLPDYVAPPTIVSGVNTLPEGVYYLDGSVDSISTTNGKDIVVAADTTVTLILTNGADLSLKGNLDIETGGQLLVYTDSDVAISGDINNDNTVYDSSSNIAPAQRLTIYGTNQTEGEQSIALNGAGELTAFIYAPNAIVTLKGGGGSDVGYLNGAVVAYNADVNGNMQFRYDRALGDVEDVTNLYDVVEWSELNNETAETAKVVMADYF